MGFQSRWVVADWSNGSRYIVLAKHGRPNHMATHSRPNDVCFIYIYIFVFLDGNAMVWQLAWGSLYVYGSFLSTISPIYILCTVSFARSFNSCPSHPSLRFKEQSKTLHFWKVIFATKSLNPWLKHCNLDGNKVSFHDPTATNDCSISIHFQAGESSRVAIG